MLLLVLLSSTSVFATDDNTKNHRIDKRQDDSYLLFGGWQPVKARGSTFYQQSSSGRYHDLLSALPDSLDASSSYYAHALPSSSNYYKDIYSYYPRPAIKSTPKKNTPVYMERLKPQRQQSKQGGRGRGGGGGGGRGSPHQFIDVQKLDLKQIQGLQDIILQAKELPLSQLNLPHKGGKGFDIVEISVQNLQHNNFNSAPRNVNRYNRINRAPQRNNKGLYGRIPQSYAPTELPLQFQYFTVPKVKSLVPQLHPKDISLTPLKLPHHISSVDDLLGIKNIQVVEIPVPEVLSSGKGNQGSHYGTRNNLYSQPQYRVPTQKSPPKSSFPANTYYAHQTKQPRKHYAPPQPAKSGYNQQQKQQELPQIEAELIKLSEHEIQQLLKNLQVVHKNQQDFLKILPVAAAAHKNQQELLKVLPISHKNQQDILKLLPMLGGGHKLKHDDVQIVLALPQGNQAGYSSQSGTYDARDHGSGEQDGGYGNKEQQQQYVAIPQESPYPSHGGTSVSHNSGGYQIENQNQEVEHNAAGYQIDDQSGGHAYEQAYQTVEETPDYGQSVQYQKVGQGNEYSQQEVQHQQQEYGPSDYNSPSQQQEVHTRQEQYIELVRPESQDGYRREPVLAVEIHQGQSVEDAIKAIDPETLKRLGAHGKDGLEIEVVEVPVEEYSAESKKTETYVSSSNTTTTTTKAPARKRITSSTTVSVSKDKSTTTVDIKSTT